MTRVALALQMLIALTACTSTETEAVIDQHGKSFTCTTRDGQEVIVQHAHDDVFRVGPNGVRKP